MTDPETSSFASGPGGGGLEGGMPSLMSELSSRLQAQRRSEAELRFALGAARMGVWGYSLQTGFLDLDDNCREFAGLDPGTQIDVDAIQRLVPAPDMERLRASIQPCIADGQDCEADFRLRRPDLSMAWVHLRARRITDRETGGARLTGVLLDMTERRMAEAREQRTTALLRTIMETAPGLIYAKDRAGRLLVANQATLDLLDASLPEALGRTDADLLGNEDARRVMENDRAVVDGGRTVTFEETAGEIDGVRRVWLSTKSPLREGDEVTGLVGVSVEITDRKLAEKALIELNRTLESRVAERTAQRDSVWRNSQDLVAVLDAQGVLHAANPAWLRLMGRDPADMVGRNYLEFIHPDDHPGSRLALERAMRESLPTFEHRLLHADGSWRWVAWVAAPEGNLTYASGRDVTAERAAAAQLALTQEQLRQSQKMEAVGQLTGGIAHDFNNLLAAITGSLELLQRRVAMGRTEGIERYATTALTASQRAAALTQRLLAFARRQPLDPRPTETDRLVAGMEDLIRRTLGPGIDLEMVLSGASWTTLCDPNQLENAILNLAINARDAMCDGGRLLVETGNVVLDEAYVRSHDSEVKPGQYVSVSVTDNGVGMSPDVLSKAFEPFFTTKALGQGTGLGLSMLYGFVKQSNGHVSIESVLGGGTRVTVYLPRLRQAGDEEGVAVGRGNGQVHDAPRVLVVDDEAALRMLVTDTLQEAGFETIEACDGLAALRLVEARPDIDLLVTDVGMPGMNGRQLAEATRALRPGMPVLFITGYSHSATTGDGDTLPHGMQILNKPFSLELLASKVRDILDERRDVSTAV
jgi:PAS domain S-box-containing protein